MNNSLQQPSHRRANRARHNGAWSPGFRRKLPLLALLGFIPCFRLKPGLHAWRLAFALLATGISAFAQTTEQGREFHQRYETSPQVSLSVTNSSGRIRITSWNEAAVQVDAVKSARRDVDLEQIQIQVTADASRVEIRTLSPRTNASWDAGLSVAYEIKVPRGATLSSVTAASASIEIIGPITGVTARASSGGITARDITGAATLTSSSGGISAEKIGGELRARSTSGHVRAVQIGGGATVASASGRVELVGIAGRATAHATSGTVEVRDVGGDAQADSLSSAVKVVDVRGRVTASAISADVIVQKAGEGVRATSVSGSVEIVDARGRIEANAVSGGVRLIDLASDDVSAKATSGPVSFSGTIQAGGRYEFESFSGDVTLLLPATSDFRLLAKSQSGSLHTEFQLQLTPGAATGGEIVMGTVGRGSADIRAASFNGSVRIKKQTGQK